MKPGDLGENITTVGLDLISLPVGTSLRIGDAVLALTGLRNPCVQISAFADGLQSEMLDRDDDGKLVRKTGVMAVVVRGGQVGTGDEIFVAPARRRPDADGQDLTRDRPAGEKRVMSGARPVAIRDILGARALAFGANLGR